MSLGLACAVFCASGCASEVGPGGPSSGTASQGSGGAAATAGSGGAGGADCDPLGTGAGEPTEPACGAPVQVVSAQATHRCARFSGGCLKCWGSNHTGYLGLGDEEHRGDDPREMGPALPRVDLGAGRRVADVAVNLFHTCAALDDGSVRCWGSISLGLEDTEPRGDEPGEMGDALPPVNLGTGRTATKLTKGAAHTCALLNGGDVKCWGFNSSGQLGLGDSASRGDNPDEMGDALAVVDLGSSRSAVAIAAGGFHSCALLDDASIKCWGANFAGQLGLRDDADRGDSPGEMGDALPAVDLGTGRTAVAVAGGAGTCALLDDASVKCWGPGADGRTGDALPPIDLGTGRTALAIASGAGNTCALLDDKSLKCWGSNARGSLGLGDTRDRHDAADLGDALPTVDLGCGRHAVSISAGCAILDDDTLKCWGGNPEGELGQGDTEDRGDEPGEMGDALPPVRL
jgi:alpha-tubulin suppressor-like RCC1 family protein